MDEIMDENDLKDEKMIIIVWMTIMDEIWMEN
jgi:hypothetical protein